MAHSDSCRWAATTSLLCLVLTPIAAQSQEKGELWETMSRLQMPGVPMDAQPIKGQHCAKKNWSEPPQSGDPSQQCKNTDFSRTADKATWSVVCENPPMTGEGEIKFNGTDSYAGTVEFKAGGTRMRMELTGKKIGTCDNPQ